LNLPTLYFRKEYIKSNIIGGSFSDLFSYITNEIKYKLVKDIKSYVIATIKSLIKDFLHVAYFMPVL
jgi:hypothetical protein